MALLLQLFLEGFEGMLLRDSEVAEPARRRLVVRIRNTRGQRTSTGGLLSISHGNDFEEGSEMTRERLVRTKCGGNGHCSHDGQPPPGRQRRSPRKILQ